MNVISQDIILQCHSAEYYSVESLHIEFHSDECRSSVGYSRVLGNHSAGLHYAGCRNSQRHSARCCSTPYQEFSAFTNLHLDQHIN
jgi:hypothetical protein